MAVFMEKISSKSLVNYPFINQPLEVYELVNGHKIIFVKKEGDLVNVSTWVKTGSINEDDEINGISHFLEHLMFKGTPAHPAGEFDRILEAKGAIVNAATWKDYTFYYVTFPKGESNENLQEVLELHADMMLNPIIPDEEIGASFDLNSPSVDDKRERHVVIEEIRMRDDQPWTKTYNELNHHMYKVHPYRRDVIGTAEIISTVSRDTIMNYYKTWYTPENMTTIVVGEFDVENVLEMLIKGFDFKGFDFNSMPVAQKHDYIQEELQTEQIYIENKGNIATAFLMFGFHGPKAKILKDSIILDALAIILGEGKSSRLKQNLIEKPEFPVFNIIGADQYHFKDGNTFFIQGNFNPAKKDEAINQIKDEIQKIIDFPIAESELEKARKKLKVQFAESAETVSEIGELIGYYMTVCDDLSMCSDYLSILENITVNDVQDTAKRYLDLNKATISVLMPELGIDATGIGETDDE